MAQYGFLLGALMIATALSACVQNAAEAPPVSAANLAGDPRNPQAGEQGDGGVKQTPACFSVTNPPRETGLPPTTYAMRGTLFSRGPLRADSVVIVFLHGGGWDAASWLRNPEHAMPVALAESGYAVITYDRLGQGDSRPAQSGPAQGWTFPDHADTLHQLVAHLRAGTATKFDGSSCDASAKLGPAVEKVVLTGVSLGGALVDLYATRFGDVQAIIPQDWSNMGPANPEPFVYIGRALTMLDADGYALFPSTKDDCRKLIFHEPGTKTGLVDQVCLGAFRRTAASELTNLGEAMALTKDNVKNVSASTAVLLTWADQSLPFKPLNNQLPDPRKGEYEMWRTDCPCRANVETWTQKDAGHGMHMHQSAPSLTARIIEFLEAHGLDARPNGGASR